MSTLQSIHNAHCKGVKLYAESDLKLKVTSFNPDIDTSVGAKHCYKLH